MTTRQDLLQLFVSLIAIASFCIGIGGWIGYIQLGEVAGQAVFLSPYFSGVVIFCGVALFIAQTFPKWTLQFALAAIIAILLARIAPLWSDAWLNGRTTSTTFATALILLGAVGALVLRLGLQRHRHRPSKADIVIAVAGVTVSIVFSLQLIGENIVTRQKFAKNSATAIANSLQDEASRVTTVLYNLSERWSGIDHLPTLTFMEDEFTRHLRDFTFFMGLALIDNNHNVVLERGRNENFRTRAHDLAKQPELQDVIAQTHASGQGRLAVIALPGLDISRTELAIAPLFSTHMHHWAIIACIDLERIVTWAMARANGSGYFRITHENSILYQNADSRPAEAIAAGEILIPVHGDVVLELSYIYTATDTGLDAEVWAEFVWLTGIVVTFLLIASQRLTQVARKHSVQLSHNALHDPLTGLPNRRSLEQTIKQACEQAKRKKRLVSIVFFDLDGIRMINDSLGHDVGDDVLIEAARRLQNQAKDEGIVTQLGNVEFVLLFVGLDLRQVQKHTQWIIDDLSRPYNIADRVLSMSVSAGIVNSDGHVSDPMELVRQADLAMLQAKQEGRNTWYVYTKDLSTQVAERLELRNDLQTALEVNALQLYYQPIVEGHSGRVIGLEALVRWLHETEGYISPERFIPLAEETGQIVALTEWSLSTACQDSGTLRKQGFPPFPVIVNISPLYFQRADFVESVQRTLLDAGLPAQFLELEITESVFLNNEMAAIQKLTRLRNMGIRTSIDDFGTGYSSLSYLKNLPVDKVKIDRSFVADVVDNPANAAITQGIISMAHHLGLTVVAEGVETVPQFAFLRRNNCDTFQGFLFARPMPFEQLINILRQNKHHFYPSDPRPPRHQV